MLYHGWVTTWLKVKPKEKKKEKPTPKGMTL